MGMTVDNVSYLTGMRQNTRVSTVEKQEQKGTEADTGKIQQSGQHPGPADRGGKHRTV